MVAEPNSNSIDNDYFCSLAKISMVAELTSIFQSLKDICSLAKISMVAELVL